MSTYHREVQQVTSRDAGALHQCRPSAVLGMLQDAATRAAVTLGVDHKSTVTNYNAFWMLARIWYRLDVPLYWNDEITIETWHRGDKGVSLYRDFDIFRDNVRIGEAVSIWVLADLDSRKLLRMSAIEEMGTTACEERKKDINLLKLRLPKEMDVTDKRVFRYSETDVNGHVNNAKYADYLCDALHLETLGQGQFVSSLQLGYLAECRPNESVDMLTKLVDGKWFVVGRDNEEKARFQGSLTLQALP